ncbi:hypothetical protein HETIRDRAFT_154086 [Heterobasidion irregulare TC 32-1]|uniref:Large ribosomal subunit protein mL43 n=1 Tax=Heterobasidion irregulare (strain TC 32-1) TaxID=747525 RepID=W4KPQ9_HETIT|nr:uncharacterized protein HETIRDRAFT_154086 [Heterobasidion irregulare TC 32-1]ETW87704.1 hypothetical protein HETIRDRAFT_154086 [Heterobasidion irregulare TC 32-1]
MTFKLTPVTKPLFRAQLSSRLSNGHVAFTPQIRKLVFEYCDKWASSANTRTYLHKYLEELASSNPHVEVVVRQRNQKQPIVRGFYVNNKDKVIPLNGLEVTGVQNKVKLLLDSSGAKIMPLKRRTVESTTESARGIWSGLHVDEPFKI